MSEVVMDFSSKEHGKFPPLVMSKDPKSENMIKKQAWNFNKSKIKCSANSSFGVSRSNLASSLFQAVLTCKISKVKFLLKKGHVSTHVTNDRGQNLLMTALYISEDNKREHMFRCLLHLGVDCSYRNKDTGRDVLGLACYLGRHAEVRRILEAGMGEIDIRQPDKDGLTPLHLAVQQGHLDVVKLLVDVMNKYHLSVDVVDKQGLTPYMYARRLGHNDIAESLVKEGKASVHRKDQVSFRSADEWAIIGAKEHMLKQKQELNKQVAFYRIRGMLPPINELRELKKKPPKITFDDDSSKSNEEEDKEKIPSNSAPSPDGSHSSDEASSSQNDLNTLGVKSNILQASPRSKRVTSLLVLNQQINQKTKERVSTLSKSVDTAFTLLGLKAEDSGMHATHFIQSELDTSKVTPNKSTGSQHHNHNTVQDLNNMMTALSEQQSSAFRVVARMRTPPPVTVKPVKERKKVSTLAILMAKDRRQRSYGARRHRRAPVSMTGRAAGKPLGHQVKAKKTSKL